MLFVEDYFMHVNRNIEFEWEENAIMHGNMIADRIVPDHKNFKRIYKHPRVFYRVEDLALYVQSDRWHFSYLFERIV